MKYPHLQKFIISCTITAALVFAAGSKAQTIVVADSGKAHVQLKIMSWNIYMLPRLFFHTGQIKRAAKIAEVLKEETKLDVIVFQEAFVKKSRNIIYELLKDSFPDQSGAPRKNSLWKSSSGVWVLSKTPLTVKKQIFFKHAKGSDRLACKGAMLLESMKDSVKFQLLGTHLQSDLKYQQVEKVRKTQYDQMRTELLEPFYVEGVIQLLTGDFNTIKSDSVNYCSMISSLNADTCQLCGNQNYSFDYSKNDFIKGQQGVPQLIDHIFMRSGNKKTVEGKMTVKIFQRKWSKKHSDLSDHYAVTGTITL